MHTPKYFRTVVPHGFPIPPAKAFANLTYRVRRSLDNRTRGSWPSYLSTPGRVKHRHSTSRKPTIATAQRTLYARMAEPDGGSSVFQLTNTADPKGSILNKQTIIWLVVVAIIVVATLVIVTCLLCRCNCKRRRAARKRHSNGHSHHPSLEVTDGRNEHIAWSRNAPIRKESDNGGDFSLTPLSKATLRPAGATHPAEPVIVEEEVPSTPVYARNKGSRYYSGLRYSWKRISQIGRAY